MTLNSFNLCSITSFSRLLILRVLKINEGQAKQVDVPSFSVARSLWRRLHLVCHRNSPHFAYYQKSKIKFTFIKYIIAYPWDYIFLVIIFCVATSSRLIQRKVRGLNTDNFCFVCYFIPRNLRVEKTKRFQKRVFTLVWLISMYCLLFLDKYF